MLAVNAVFAAYEIALASAPRGKLLQLAERRAYGAAQAVFMKEHLEGSLALVQLAITLAGAVAAATGGAGVGVYLVPYIESGFGIGNAAAEMIGIAVFVVPLSVVTIVFSELVPKMFAIENNEKITLLLSPAMRILYRLFNPLISFFERVVKFWTSLARRLLPGTPARQSAGDLEDLWAATAYARSRNVITIFEEKLANSALLFSRRTVRDVLVPAADVSTIPVSLSLSDALIRAHTDMHTRFPVLEKEGDFGTVTGYLNFKDIVTALRLSPAAPSVRGITRPMKNLSSDMPLSRALQEMLADNAHMAVVREKTGAIGIVTLETIIETLVGKMNDEYDRLPVYVHRSGDSVIAGGGAALSAVCAELGVACPGEDMPLALWARARLGRAVRGGDIVKTSGMELWVRKTRRRQLLEAVIIRI